MERKERKLVEAILPGIRSAMFEPEASTTMSTAATITTMTIKIITTL